MNNNEKSKRNSNRKNNNKNNVLPFTPFSRLKSQLYTPTPNCSARKRKTYATLIPHLTLIKMSLRPRKNKKEKERKKKKPCFTDLPGRVGRSGFFLVSLFLSGGTNDHPQKSLKQCDILLRKNISSYFTKFSSTWPKTADFTRFQQIKKNISQNAKSASVGPVKQGFLFSWPNNHLHSLRKVKEYKEYVILSNHI